MDREMIPSAALHLGFGQEAEHQTRFDHTRRRVSKASVVVGRLACAPVWEPSCGATTSVNLFAELTFALARDLRAALAPMPRRPGTSSMGTWLGRSEVR